MTVFIKFVAAATVNMVNAADTRIPNSTPINVVYNENGVNKNLLYLFYNPQCLLLDSVL